jgi:hypothetical protein
MGGHEDETPFDPSGRRSPRRTSGQSMGDWPWSNYRSTAGLQAPPPWLETNWTIAQFGSGAGAKCAYREFVGAGSAALVQPWKNIAGQLFLGSEDFRRRMLEKVDA